MTRIWASFVWCFLLIVVVCLGWWFGNPPVTLQLAPFSVTRSFVGTWTSGALCACFSELLLHLSGAIGLGSEHARRFG